MSIVLLALGLVLLASCGSSSPQEDEASIEVSVVGPGFVVVGDFSCKGTQTCTWTGPADSPVRFLIASPDPGYHFGQWSGDCAPAGIATECTVSTPGEATGIGARFARRVLRLDITGDGEGTFDIIGGGVNTTCVTDCAVFPNDQPVSITLQEAAGTVPGDWGGACADASNDRYCLLTVSGATEVSKALETEGPSLTLTKAGVFQDEDGDDFADVGETIDYTFTITNDGNVALTTITLTDPLVTVTGGPIASLDPGASDTSTFTATYTVTQADIDAGEVTNTATADSDQTGAVDDGDTVTLPQDPALSFTKAGVFQDEDGDTFADVGETIDYTFTITNDGNVTLTNVTLTDPLVTLTGSAIASLAPDTTDDTTFTATYTVTQDDIDAGEVTNTATADSDQTDPTLVSDTVVLPNPVLRLTKTGTFNDEDGDTFADVGETIAYTFTLRNDGTVTLTNITLTDPLVTVDGGPIASLSPEERDDTTFKATYTITQDDIDAGEVTNTATADSDQADPVDDSDTVVLTAP